MSGGERIPLGWPAMTGREIAYIGEALAAGRLSGDGPFTRRCHEWLERRLAAPRVLLTHSCTAALEMAALLLDLEPGDEVIMPSFTFVSTANAFVLRGAVPVFVDIRPDTLNLDETLVEAAITPRTRAIVPVHYAGIACDMDEILRVARRHDLKVVEDAAQGLGASYKGRPLGSIGDFGAFSFHETKNIVSGEGGALAVNGDRETALRAEIIREKGTDRSRFLRGEVDKYTWQDVGSSYLPSELVAAFLFAQLEQADDINGRRLGAWQHYHDALEDAEIEGALRRPVVPEDCSHNGHIYYVLVNDAADRARILEAFRRRGVQAAHHYVPLHSAPAGLRYGRMSGGLAATDDLSARLLRLPLASDIRVDAQDQVLSLLTHSLKS
ncbi:MAG: dTDP-4-amino-4,6-dideoxygalactose transaminase [Rhizobiaceae bacterium]|nr:dTDP-4-amino-4,6-dideoxygalactose transaminase [Rhizobiaceae bacterium]